MSLANKTIALFSLLGICLCVGAYAVQKLTVQPAFVEFEEQSSLATAARVRDALTAELRSLDVLNTEYSYWDDTYVFAQGNAPSYVADYLRREYLADSGIDLFAIFDLEGNELYRFVEGRIDDQAPALQQLLLEPLTSTHPLFKLHEVGDWVDGYLRTTGGLMQVVSYPIVRTSGDGPAVGTLAVGRYLSDEILTSISDQVTANIRFLDVNAQTLPRHVLNARSILTADSEQIQVALGDDMAHGIFMIRDVFDAPTAIVEVTSMLSVGGIASKTITWATLLMAGASLLFIAAAWYLSQVFVIRPIRRLIGQIDRIRETGNLEVDIRSRRTDEIGVLSSNFGALTVELGDTQKALEEARDSAIAASAMKSDFLARMSHEIRTPMNGVLGMTEILRQTPLSAKQSTMAATIHESANALLDIVNDILDFSKIEAGKLDVTPEASDLPRLLDNIVAAFTGVAERKGLKLTYDLDSPPATLMFFDPKRLRQILSNLIANAIKFTQSGSVTLKVTCHPADAPVQRVDFSVTDTGIGISPDKQSAIFDAFTQADESTTRHYGGTGLGLAISQQLVEHMGGELRVDSAPGQGSTFSFSLSLKTDDTPRSPSEADPMSGTEGIHVLIADDNRVDCMIAAAMLERLGYSTKTVHSGAAAIHEAASGAYSAILMDCQMPLVDGLKATEVIREQAAARDDPDILIIALTGDTAEADRNRCLAVGMDDCLAKPCSAEDLQRALAVLPDRLGSRRDEHDDLDRPAASSGSA